MLVNFFFGTFFFLIKKKVHCPPAKGDCAQRGVRDEMICTRSPPPDVVGSPESHLLLKMTKLNFKVGFIDKLKDGEFSFPVLFWRHYAVLFFLAGRSAVRFARICFW